MTTVHLDHLISEVFVVFSMSLHIQFEIWQELVALTHHHQHRQDLEKIKFI